MTPTEFIESLVDPGTGRSMRTTRGVITGVGPPLTEQDIAEAEVQLGYAIPPDFRRWLLLCNGGVPKWGRFGGAYFTWLEGGQLRADSVDSLFGINHPVPAMDLVKDNAEMKARLPEGMMAIGTANFQNPNRRFLLAFQGPETGAVFDWRIVRKGRTSTTHLDKQASTFEQFWDSLVAEYPSTPL